MLGRLLSWLGWRRAPKDPPCTWDQYYEIMGRCMVANAHEDRLFDEFWAKCKAEGREFDLDEFKLYAGEHWQLDYDAHGYRKRFQASRDA